MRITIMVRLQFQRYKSLLLNLFRDDGISRAYELFKHVRGLMILFLLFHLSYFIIGFTR